MWWKKIRERRGIKDKGERANSARGRVKVPLANAYTSLAAVNVGLGWQTTASELIYFSSGIIGTAGEHVILFASDSAHHWVTFGRTVTASERIFGGSPVIVTAGEC